MRLLRRLSTLIAVSLAGSGCVYHSEVIVHTSHSPRGAIAVAGEACCLHDRYPGSALWQTAAACGGASGECTTHRIEIHRLGFDWGGPLDSRPCGFAPPPLPVAPPGRCTLQAPRPHAEQEYWESPPAELPAEPPPVATEPHDELPPRPTVSQPPREASPARPQESPSPESNEEPVQLTEPELPPGGFDEQGVIIHSPAVEREPTAEVVPSNALPPRDDRELNVAPQPISIEAPPPTEGDDAEPPEAVPANELPVIRMKL